MSDNDAAAAPLKKTALYDLHIARGGRMVGFAGYEMPVQFPLGILKEHQHTRSAAGLFDVSHMGQIVITANSGDVDDAALALEALLPTDLKALREGRQRYTFFTNEAGGLLDDLMVAKLDGRFVLVVNAATKTADEDHLKANLPDTVRIDRLDRALVALQGPKAAEVFGTLAPECTQMRFMDVRQLEICGALCTVSRSGYTGEDGFEISLPQDAAETIAQALLDRDDVEPIGLGARDSLRLEAGLCLYGNDIDINTTPVEAGLSWAIPKSRRDGGERAAGFPGDEVILRQLRESSGRRRVGLLPEGRAPVRAGAQLFQDETGGTPVGHITSGGFGPSLGRPIAMGYVPSALASPEARFYADVRGKRLPLDVSKLPFNTPGYKRT